MTSPIPCPDFRDLKPAKRRELGRQVLTWLFNGPSLRRAMRELNIPDNHPQAARAFFDIVLCGTPETLAEIQRRYRVGDQFPLLEENWLDEYERTHGLPRTFSPSDDEPLTIGALREFMNSEEFHDIVRAIVCSELNGHLTEDENERCANAA